MFANLSSVLLVLLSQPKSTSTQVGSDKVMSRTTHPTHPPLKLLRHFQTTYEANFWYALILTQLERRPQKKNARRPQKKY